MLRNIFSELVIEHIIKNRLFVKGFGCRVDEIYSFIEMSLTVVQTTQSLRLREKRKKIIVRMHYTVVNSEVVE